MKKFILVLNNHGLGDVVMSIAFFENLLTMEKRKIIVVLLGNAEIELFMQTKMYQNNSEQFILKSLKNIKTLFVYCLRIDLAFSLGVNEKKSNFLFKMLMIKKYKIGNPYEYNYSSKKQLILNPTKLHKEDLYASMLQDFYNNTISINYDQKFVVSEPFFSNTKEYIVIAPGSFESEKHKRWTSSGYQKLICELLKNMKYKIVFVGSKNEESFVKEIVSGLDCQHENTIILNGKTSIKELISVLSFCKLAIGADTGVLHIAAASNTPIVSLFGPTDFNITGPKGNIVLPIINQIECSPCYSFGHSRGCDDNVCMKGISHTSVLNECNKILGLKNGK